MRKLLGTILKNPDEAFQVGFHLGSVLGTGETITLSTSSASALSRGSSPPVNTSAAVLVNVASVPTVTIFGSELRVHFKASVAGKHVVEVDAITNLPSRYEGEWNLIVAERKPVLYIDKYAQEGFIVSNDFARELYSETIQTATATSRDRFTGVDTTSALLEAASVSGSKVTAELKKDLTGATIGKHIITLQATTDHSPEVSVYEETIELEVIASPVEMGTVSGTITDSGAAQAVGATVVLSQTGKPDQTTTTDGSGDYSFISVILGAYTLAVTFGAETGSGSGTLSNKHDVNDEDIATA